MRRPLLPAVIAVLQFACSSGNTTQPQQQQPSLCNDSCPTESVTRCGSGQLQTCVADANGCLAWSAAAPCPGTQVCDAAGEKCVDETPACTSKCETVGATQCVGAQIATCNLQDDGCRDWDAPQPCPNGKTCDGTTNKCVNLCDAADVLAVCGAAAAKYMECCGNTYDAWEVCAEFGGADPKAFCEAEAAKACGTLHDEWLTEQHVCCCPRGESCDGERGFACETLCTRPSDCANSASGPACAPIVSEDKVVDRTRMCKPADGTAWHGCASGGVCDSGYDCWEDAAGNQSCVRSCDTNAACNNVYTACCIKPPSATCDNPASSPCGNVGGCMPCP